MLDKEFVLTFARSNKMSIISFIFKADLNILSASLNIPNLK